MAMPQIFPTKSVTRGVSKLTVPHLKVPSSVTSNGNGAARPVETRAMVALTSPNRRFCNSKRLRASNFRANAETREIETATDSKDVAVESNGSKEAAAASIDANDAVQTLATDDTATIPEGPGDDSGDLLLVGEDGNDVSEAEQKKMEALQLGRMGKLGKLNRENISLKEEFFVEGGGIMECESCNYLYDPEIGDPEYPIVPDTKFEDLPANWECPICNSSKSQFQSIGVEKAGYEVNQDVGLGFNSWTSRQKEALIFGSLGLFALVFLLGYGLE